MGKSKEENRRIKINKKFVVIVIFISLLIIFSSCKKTTVISGKVEDNYIDLPGVEVIMIDNGGKEFITYTDWNGIFKFKLNTRLNFPLKLSFNRPGYKNKMIEVKNNEDKISNVKLFLNQDRIVAFSCPLEDNFNRYKTYIGVIKELESLGYKKEQIRNYLDKKVIESYKFKYDYFPLETDNTKKIENELEIYSSENKKKGEYFPCNSKLDGPYKISDIYNIANNYIYNILYDGNIIGWFDMHIIVHESKTWNIDVHSKIILNSKNDILYQKENFKKRYLDNFIQDSYNKNYNQSPFENKLKIIKILSNEKKRFLSFDYLYSPHKNVIINEIKDLKEPKLYFLRYDIDGYYLLFQNKNKTEPDLVVNINKFLVNHNTGYKVVSNGEEFLKDLERMRFIQDFLYEEFRKEDLFSYEEHILWFLYQQWNCESSPLPLDIRYRKYAKENNGLFNKFRYIEYLPSKYDILVIETFLNNKNEK